MVTAAASHGHCLPRPRVDTSDFCLTTVHRYYIVISVSIRRSYLHRDTKALVKSAPC